jgi:glycosyltransferase involved in cell wall biosynthesis
MLIKDFSNKVFLFVGHYPPPFGGIASLISELMHVLKKTNSVSHILNFSDKNSISKVDGGTLHEKKNTIFILFFFFLRSPKIFFKATRKINQFNFKDIYFYMGVFNQAIIISLLIKKIKPNSITIYGSVPGAIIPFIELLNPGNKINYCVFAHMYEHKSFYHKHRKHYREALAISNKVFATSLFCSKSISYLNNKIKAEVIFIGVDTKKFKPIVNKNPIRKLYNIPADCFVVLSVARMLPQMGTASIVNIAKTVIEKQKNILFIVAGAKGTMTNLVEDAAKNSNNQIKSLVDFPFDKLPQLYQVADLLIAPTVSKQACMGVAVKEAMSSGIPALVTNSGGLPEAIRNNIDGYVIPLKKNEMPDDEIFIKKIIRIQKDKNKMSRMGKSARKRAIEVFSNETMLDNYIKLLS